MKERKNIFRLMCMVGLAAVWASGKMQAANSALEWERVWLDAIDLHWQPPTEAGGVKALAMELWKPKFSFEVSSDNTVSDGRYVYSGVNPFSVYDMEGKFIEEFTIPGLPEMYRMTTDGTFFYGITYEQFGIYKVDFKNRKLVNVIPTEHQLYHIAYIPSLDGGKGGFEVGTPIKGWFYTMGGELLDGSMDYAADFGSSCFCSASTCFNDKLYVYALNNTETRIVWEYDLKTLKATGNKFDLNAFQGQAGVDKGFHPRGLFAYTHSDNRQYLMCIDYNGLEMRASSVLVGECAFVEGLDGYNIYRDEVKLNGEVLDKLVFSYSDEGLEEEREYTYSLKTVVNGKEGEVFRQAKIQLPSTGRLPLVDDFDSYPLTFDHPSLRLEKEYWTITPKLPSYKWAVVKNSNGKCMQFSYSPDMKYKQIFESRTLSAPDGERVMLGFKRAGNTYISGLSTEQMLVDVSVDGGSTWQTAGSINYKSSTTYQDEIFDLTDYTSGKNFKIRLKGAGTSPDQTYNWQIDDLKIWSYIPVDVVGKVNLLGVADYPNLKLVFLRDKTGARYDISTGKDGSFALTGVESGTYDIIVSNGRYSYTVENFQIDASATDYQLDVPGGFFASEETDFAFSVMPGDDFTASLPFYNRGNDVALPKISLEFVKETEGEVFGNSDLDVNPDWAVTTSFELESSSESKVFYYEEKLYSCVQNHSAVQLKRYSMDGKKEEMVTLVPDSEMPSTCAGYFVMNGSLYLYTTPKTYINPAVPAYIIPVDMQNLSIHVGEKKALPVEISSIMDVKYSPKEEVLYVKDGSNALYKCDMDGTVQKKYTLPQISYRGIAIDTFSDGGPFLWMINSKSNPAGTEIVKYSLITEQLTMVSYDVNNYKESIFNGVSGMVSVDHCHLFGSSTIVPGYYSLLVTQGLSTRSGQRTSQVLVYPIFSYETWIAVEGSHACVAPGEAGNVNVTVNGIGLADKTVKQANIRVSSSNFSDDILMSVNMTVDKDLVNKYLPVGNMVVHVDENYQSVLEWDIPATNEKVEYYKIFRDGILLEDGVKVNTYTDILPKYGMQAYQILAVYESGHSALSGEVSIEVKNPNWGVPAANRKEEVVVRKNVLLSWDSMLRLPAAYYEDFESYQPFATENLGMWTLVDGDKSWTYGSTTFDYPNEETRMAGIVYNPKLTSPVDNGVKDNGSEQCFAFVSGRTPMYANDDWLISPQLELVRPGVLRFDACARSLSYGDETLQVGYSVTGKDSEDFVWIADTLTVNPTWTQYEFNIPATAKYVALHYVSTNTYMLFIDNIFVGLADNYTTVSGYNLYRDGKKLNDEPMSGCNYTDYNLTDGTYHYRLETLYANGATAQGDFEPVVIDFSIKANPPRNLNLLEQEGESVLLEWDAPQLADSEKLFYGNGEVSNSLGGIEQIYVAAKWDAEMMNLYTGYSITGLNFHIAEPVKSVVPLLFVDGMLMRSGEEFQPKVGEYSEFVFDMPLVVQQGRSYMVGYKVQVESGYYPLSHDAGPGKPGYSDLYSVDGENWQSMYEAYQDESYNFNWCIALNLEYLPVTEDAAASSGSKSQVEVSDAVDCFDGYRVYRNGEVLNEVLLDGTEYVDTPSSSCEYQVAAVYKVSGEVFSDKVFYTAVSISQPKSDREVYVQQNILYVDGHFDGLNLYSLQGNLLYGCRESKDFELIDITNLAAGIYVLEVLQDGQIDIYKIMKK